MNAVIGIQPPVTIIGAGIGGLVLARALLSHGIRSIIYEKFSPHERGFESRHNYGISINEHAYAELTNRCNIQPHDLRLISVQRGKVEPFPLNPKRGHPSKARYLHRSSLERLLSQSLDIKYGEEVTVDEESIKGELGGRSMPKFRINNESTTFQQNPVVVADGVHSKIRTALLPTLKSEALPYVAFYGRRRITRQQFNSSYAPAFNKGNVISTLLPYGPRLQVMVSRFHTPTALVGGKLSNVADINYLYSRKAFPSSITDPLYNPDRGTDGASDIPPRFYDEIAALPELDLPYSDIFDLKKVKSDRVVNWLARRHLASAQDLTQIAQQQGVIFLGDAVHARPYIAGGDGAGSAITTAAALASRIALNRNSDGSVDIGPFYTERSEQWQWEFEHCVEPLDSMHRPFLDEPVQKSLQLNYPVTVRRALTGRRSVVRYLNG